MTNRIEEFTYKRSRRYVFFATFLVIVVLFALPFLL